MNPQKEEIKTPNLDWLITDMEESQRMCATEGGREIIEACRKELAELKRLASRNK